MELKLRLTGQVRTYHYILNARETWGIVYFIPRPNESLLFTSSILWNAGCRSVEEFYNKCVGVPLQLLPTVLGLKFAVDLELGSRYCRFRRTQNYMLNTLPYEQRFRYTKTSKNQIERRFGVVMTPFSSSKVIRQLIPDSLFESFLNLKMASWRHRNVVRFYQRWFLLVFEYVAVLQKGCHCH